MKTDRTLYLKLRNLEPGDITLLEFLIFQKKIAWVARERDDCD